MPRAIQCCWREFNFPHMPMPRKALYGINSNMGSLRDGKSTNTVLLLRVTATKAAAKKAIFSSLSSKKQRTAAPSRRSDSLWVFYRVVHLQEVYSGCEPPTTVTTATYLWHSLISAHYSLQRCSSASRCEFFTNFTSRGPC